MLAHLATAAALLGTVPAVAPGDPPVTGVTLAWTTVDGSRQILVTWQETGALRNRADVVRLDGSPLLTGQPVEADRPDSTTLPPRLAGGSGTVRVAVRVLDDEGEPVGEPALSPVFDTDKLPAVRLDAVNPRVDGTVELRWTPRPPVPDDTPGDPLDLPVDDPVRAVPIASGDVPFRRDELSGPVTGPSFVVPAERRPPLLVGLKTVNEWGETEVVTEVFGTRVTATVPARATDGARLPITGTVHEAGRACDLTVCWAVEYPDRRRVVQLQARTGTAAAWQVVATARTADDGTYRLGVVSPGTREYRVVAPPVSTVPSGRARAYAASAPVTVTSVPPAAVGSGSGSGGGGGLPITGAPAGVVAGAGLLLVVLGVLLRVAGRRRRTP
jgi:hypothetical protein